MKIRCIIVDDELPAQGELTYLLSEFADVEVVGTASSAARGVEAVEKHRPDLVFMDIQMPGRNGLDAAHEIMKLDSPPLIVFQTAFDQYAIRAFEENAVDYILKPVSAKRLSKTLDRVRAKLRDAGAEEHAPSIDDLLAAMRQAPEFTRVSVEKDGRIMLLDPREIVFCRSEGKRIMAHTQDDTLAVHGIGALEKLEKRLQSYPFFRASRGDLVNLPHVREFSPWYNGKYVLVMADRNATEVVVTRSRVKEFKERLGL